MLSLVFLAVFVLLAWRGVKAYYLSPSYPPVLALGALWLDPATIRCLSRRCARMSVFPVSGVLVAHALHAFVVAGGPRIQNYGKTSRIAHRDP